MYPWEVLGIEATKDKKAIKKAYATLLRQYRPDSHPEKFQEINQAYQFALTLMEQDDYTEQSDNYLESEVADSALNHSEPIQENASSDDLEFVPNSQEHNYTHADDFDQEWQIKLGEDILEQFHQLAFAEYSIKKKKENWEFLSKYHELEDFGLRESLSHEIFRRLVEYNHFQQNENGTLLLNQPVARIIAEHLNWDNEWQTLDKVFPPNYSQHVFRLLEDVDTIKNSASMIPRVFAVYLEVALLNIALLSMGFKEFNFQKEMLLLGLYVLSSSLFSLSKLNLPLIQYFFDLRLFDKFINKPSFKQKLLRLLIYHLSMIPVYAFFLDSLSFSPWSEMLLCLVVVVNLISWIKTKQLFHDWVSGTIVLK